MRTIRSFQLNAICLEALYLARFRSKFAVGPNRSPLEKARGPKSATRFIIFEASDRALETAVTLSIIVLLARRPYSSVRVQYRRAVDR